jgi:hypothetical protein
MSRYPGRILSSTAPTVSALSAKGIWTLDEALRYQRAGTWPVPTGGGDPYFGYNTLLLPGQGTNLSNNNTFQDSSANNFTVFRNGNTTQGTFTPFSEAPGYWSNYFDGSSKITTPSSADFGFGTGDFHISFWAYLVSDANKTFFGNGTDNLNLYVAATTKYIGLYTGSTNDSTTVAPLNQWAFFVVTRTGSSLQVYLNNVSILSISNSTNFSTTSFAIGSNTSTSYINSYISNFKIVKGVAWTPAANPTSPSTADANTKLLTCQSNRFVDNSTNAFAFTVTGSPSVQTFQPFGAPTSAYSAATIGGSGYFDGSGDYLTVADNAAFEFGSGDFTIELWVNTTSSSQYDSLVSKESGAVAGAWSLQVNSSSSTSGNVAFWSYDYNSFSAEMVTTTGVSIRDGGWHHVALVRNGSSWVIYIDGVSRGTQTSSVTLGNSSADVWIANNQSTTTRDLPGYISGLRVVKGTAVYTAAFTPPTAPPTAIANTSLLLNFTNGGVIDNALSNNLETVNDAKISTAQYKWGASSMFFDGNGDNLSGPSTPALNCGTSDFTIEGWVYVSSRTLNYPVIFGNNNGSYTAGALALTNNSAANVAYNNKFCLNAYDINSSGPPALVSSSTNALNTWYHLALVRVGTTLKMFVNGNQTASTTISSSIVFNWGKGGVLVGGGNWDTTNSYFHGYINDLRLTNGYARYQYPFTAPAAPFPLFYQAAATPSSDPYFQNTTLLLPGNGTTGANNNTFLDSSGNGNHPARNGNPTQGTFTPFSKVDGRWGNYFDGNGDYLSCGNNAALSAGAGDFTVEFWLSLNSIGVNDTSLFEARSSNGSATGFHIGALALTGGYCINFYTNATANLTSSLIPYRSWTHIAVARSGSSLKVYVNGISELSITNSANFSDTPTFTIGQSPLYSSNSLNGDMSNFRMVKGTAVYTSNFVPSTTPLTAITNTQLLTCQSNRFIDNSTNAFAITRNGDVSVQTFSPFPTLTAYASGTNGGSGYFDVTGDTLSAGSNAAFALGTGDFTVETFAYYVAQSNVDAIAVANWDGVTWGSNKWSLHLDHTTARAKVTFWFHNYSSTVPLLTSTNTLTIGQWHHVAVSRSGNTFRLFINGVLDVSATNSTSLDGGNNSPIYVGGGGGGAGSQYFNGYLSSTRLVKGTAVYTATFTTPTAPLTAVSGTSLLLNYTNGGIIDNTMSNDLETVGGASISTTQSKFGGSSMFFDGNDKVTLPYSQNFNLGTNYTIEGWVYPTSVTGYQRIFDIVNSATSSPAFLDIAFNGTALVSELRTTNGGAVTTISGGTVSTGAWIHVALSVYSGSARLFLNGVQVGSTTTFSALPDQNFVGIGGIGNSLTIDYLTGYIDDLRITKGIARYVQNFTPPTQAFLTL